MPSGLRRFFDEQYFSFITAFLATFLAAFVPAAFAYPIPTPGSEDLPKLVAASSLVCKGEVTDAPAPVVVQATEKVTRMTAVAHVRPDRCFKGSSPGSISVLVDGFITCCGPSFNLRKGDYRLLFLTQQDGTYAVVDLWSGALPVSRESTDAQEIGDPLYLLELDFKAGLRDSNPERVLDSIRMLGNLKQVRSIAELKELETSADLLVRTHVWQSLLRLKDYSVLPAVSAFFDTQPEMPRELYLPRDRVFQMQAELQQEMSSILDPGALPYLERFATSGRTTYLRMSALQALRRIGSFNSAETYLQELSDSNTDNGFSAMQGLLSLAGGGESGSTDWVPTWEQFKEAPEAAAAKCREWWVGGGQRKASIRAQHTLHFSLRLPEAIPSDLAQIHYVAVRSGNGYAEVLRQPAKPHVYEVREPAEKLRIIAHMPGCYFVTRELITGMSTEQSLPCRPLRAIQLKGKITNPELIAGKSVLVEVAIVADQIFNVVDTSFTTFPMVNAPLDSNGAFTVLLPDLFSDPVVKGWGKGSKWQIVVRELGTSNVLARLRLANADEKTRGLDIQSSYQDINKFNAVPN